jgi:glutathione synthase/RimK-type ligase-like ATP-grasp enzyme
LRLALVTYAGLPQLSADDQLLLGPLAARGIRGEPAAWDDGGVDWASYDALLVRSTWNYHTSLAAFMEWVDRIESTGIPAWNPPAILRWNARKTYLGELAARGVDVVPTRWITDGDGLELADVLTTTGWSDVVVKPTVSASAYETWRVASGRASPDDAARFRRVVLRPGGAMVQPFLSELATTGEWSLMFVDGEYSHAVLKRPRAGDFRVQHEHGGSATALAPPKHVIGTAREITEQVSQPWLYARVDGVEIGGRFVLVELELLEPSMFLGADRDAPARFADAVRRRLRL